MTDALVVVHPDPASLASATAGRLVVAIADAQARRGQADVVLTGGGVGTAILAAVPGSRAAGLVDWGRVRLWWGDERFLPTGDPDRNDTAARAELVDVLPFDPALVHPIPGPDRAADPDDSARRYAATLAEHGGAGGLPVFDVVLLGVGADGHVASLFPGDPATRKTAGSVVGVWHAPKPPPRRVSLTFPALRHTRAVWLVVAGADKASAVARSVGGEMASDDPGRDPAGRVWGREQTRWLVDAAAAAALPGQP